MSAIIRHSVDRGDIPTIVVAVSRDPTAQLNAISLSLVRTDRRLRQPGIRRSVPHLVALLHEMEKIHGSLLVAHASTVRIARPYLETDGDLLCSAENAELGRLRLVEMAGVIQDPSAASVQADIALMHLRRGMHYLRRAVAAAQRSRVAELN
jgi:hypothetical protein